MPVTTTDTWEETDLLRDLATRINVLGMAHGLADLFADTPVDEYIVRRKQVLSRYRFVQSSLERLAEDGFGFDLADWRLAVGLNPGGFRRDRFVFGSGTQVRETTFGIARIRDIIGTWVFNEIEAGVEYLELLP